MSTELIAVFAMTITILTTMGIMFRSLRNDVKSDIASVKTELGAAIASVKAELGVDIACLHDGQKTINDRLSALSERMAHLEGLLEGLREAITGRSAA